MLSVGEEASSSSSSAADHARASVTGLNISHKEKGKEGRKEEASL